MCKDIAVSLSKDGKSLIPTRLEQQPKMLTDDLGIRSIKPLEKHL